MKKRTKLIIIIAVIAAVLAAAITAFVLVNNKKTPAPEPEKAEVKVKDQVSAELMSEVLSARDFFEILPEDKTPAIKYSFDGKEVSFSEKYDRTGYFKVILNDGETEYDSVLCIKDTTPPVLETKDIELETETDFQEADLVASCTDNSGKDCTYSLKNPPDFTVPGEHEVTVVATDESGNSTEKQAKVTVKERPAETPDSSEPTEETKPSSGSSSGSKPSSSSNPSSGKAKFVKSDYTLTTETKQLKYGVKAITTHRTDFDLYSDGSKRNVFSTDHTEYDRSGFSATTSDMVAEALQNMKTYSSEVNTVLTETNKIRAKSMREPLVYDEEVTKAAMVRAIEMAYAMGNYISHNRPDGRSCFSVFDDLGIPNHFAGENIAAGQPTPQMVVQQWEASSGHYANIISEHHHKIGIGVIKLEGHYFWVQLFTD